MPVSEYASPHLIAEYQDLHPTGDYYGGWRLPEYQLEWLDKQSQSHPLHIVGRHLSCLVHQDPAVQGLALTNDKSTCGQLSQAWAKNFIAANFNSILPVSSSRQNVAAQSMGLAIRRVWSPINIIKAEVAATMIARGMLGTNLPSAQFIELATRVPELAQNPDWLSKYQDNPQGLSMVDYAAVKRAHLLDYTATIRQYPTTLLLLNHPEIHPSLPKFFQLLQRSHTKTKCLEALDRAYHYADNPYQQSATLIDLLSEPDNLARWNVIFSVTKTPNDILYANRERFVNAGHMQAWIREEYEHASSQLLTREANFYTAHNISTPEVLRWYRQGIAGARYVSAAVKVSLALPEWPDAKIAAFAEGYGQASRIHESTIDQIRQRSSLVSSENAIATRAIKHNELKTGNSIESQNRQALIDLLAVAPAWIEQLTGAPQPGQVPPTEEAGSELSL